MSVNTSTEDQRRVSSNSGGRNHLRLPYIGAIASLVLFLTPFTAVGQQNTATALSELNRFREGLRRAKPVPEPQNALRSMGPTASRDLVRFDPMTRQASRMPLSKANATSLMNELKGHPGMEPVRASGQQQVILGDNSGSAATAESGSQRTVAPTIVPSVPGPLLQPYFYPARTQFRLLMRFPVPGEDDQFYLCSASSISSFHLISAGHCLYNHDPLGNGSRRGAGFAAEIWAWPAETDYVYPLNADIWPDLPWGLAKMVYATTYEGWINTKDFNWDIGWLTLDRRMGDRVGMLGVEYGVSAATLNYSGYPSEEPYVPFNNPFQYLGGDNQNVINYTCCRILMNAYTYGGHSGGGVWRFDPNVGQHYFLEGVNSTSNRHGYAEATLFTSQIHTDLVNTIAIDRAQRMPVDRPQLVEYVFDNASKGLNTTAVAPGHPFSFKINAFNSGFAASGTITADIYLTPTLRLEFGIQIGSIVLGQLGPNQYEIYPAGLVLPTTVVPGEYNLGWALRGTNQQYESYPSMAIITQNKLRVVGLSKITTNPTSVVGGSTATATVQLTGPAPQNGTGDGIDVLLSGYNNVAQFTNFIHIKTDDTSATFNITTTPVTKNTNVVITANLNGITRTATLLVKPAAGPTALNSVSLNPGSVVGGNNSTATVSLSGPAPAGGATVNLSSNNAKASVPATVKIPPGSTSATFTVKTSTVSATTTVSIKATYSGVSKSAALSIKPVQPVAITLAPPALKGGKQSTATITINGPAPTGGATIALASSNAHAIVPKIVKVNAGSSTATVLVNTTAVSANTVATIKATAGGISKSADLTIQP